MKKFVCFLICSLFAAVSVKAADVVVLDENDMSAAVLREFVEQGYGEEAEFDFFGGQTTFALQDIKDAKIMISNLRLEEEQNKFSVEAEIFADGILHDKTQLSGKYYLLESVYVPVEDIEKGTLITDAMLKSINMRASRIKRNHLVEKEKLVGMQAQKLLKAGKLIMDREIGKEIIVRKGDVVTAIYQTKGMQITSKAEALENGAKGQRIDLENTKSGKKFNAKILDATSVMIDVE